MNLKKTQFTNNKFSINQIIIIFAILFYSGTINTQDSIVKKVYHDWESNFTYVDDNGWSYPDRFNFQTNDNTGIPVLDCKNGRLFGVFNSVSKTFTNLPKHYRVNVTIGFSYIMSWDPNEKLTIQIDSNTVYERFNDIMTGDLQDQEFCHFSDTLDFNQLILPRKNSFTLDHTSQNISISLVSNLDENLNNESFAIQDVIISVQTCYFTCDQCTGPLPTDCSSCPSNSTQNGNECKCNENFVAFENQCISTCPVGYTENINRICVQNCTIENCQNCIDQKCTQCNINYKLLNGNCYESCPWFTTDQGAYCQDQFYIDIQTKKSYAVMDFMESEFNNLKIKNLDYQLGFQEEYNSQGITSYFNYSQQCIGKQLILGFLQYPFQDCQNNDCFIKKTFTGLRKHYKVLLRLLAFYGDSMDENDSIQYYIDNNVILSYGKQNGTTNICGTKENDQIENIQLEIQHTSSSLEFRIDTNLDEFGYNEWYGFRDLSIVLYECINQFCSSCLDGNTCISCEGIPGLPSTRTGNQCECQLGYYSDGSIQCSQCNNKCLSCLNNSQCETCKFLQLNNRIPSSQCQCPNGYFDKADEVDCQKCTRDCFTCETTSTNCILSCDHKCNGCEGSVSTCISCRGDRINAECICDVHQYDDGTSENCQDCDVSCDTCNLTDKCTVCKGNRVPVGGDSHQCECSGSDINHLPLTYYCTSCNTGILQKVELSQDYLQILLQFYVDIEIFNYKENTTLFSNNLCSHILKNETLLKLGGNVECRIESTDSILIQFKDSPTIQIGDMIELTPKSINKVDCATAFQEFYLNELTLNSNPFPPTIELQGPTSTVSLCETVQILVTEISNDGYRGLTDITWTLNETNDGDISEIQQILTNHQNKNFVEFKPLQLNENKTYKIKVEFKNKFNKIGIQTITIVSKFKSGIQAQISQTESFLFKNFKQIYLEGSMKYLECQKQGIIQEQNKQLNVKWVQNYNGVETVLSEYISDEKDKLSILTIPPYSHIAGESYQIHFEVSLLENNQIQGSNSSQYKILTVPLLVYIQGGSRMNAYASELNLFGVAKNLNVILEEQENDITYQWKCINLNQNMPCTQIDGTQITFNSNSKQQYFPEKIFEPYNSLQFTFIGQKGTETQLSNSIIIIVETDLPLLLVSVPESFLSTKLNKNDDLQINIMNDYSLNDQIFFSLILIYDFEVVATKSYEYTSFSFRIWDLFDNFKPTNNNLLLKISMYNPKYFMPSQTSFNIVINSPPQNGSIVVTPLQGISLQTEFQIELINYTDNDSPLSYKYQFYTSLQSYENEKLAGQNPTSSQKNVLSDFTIQNQFTTILPQGSFNEKNNKYELLIMVTVSDSLGGITNVTQTIQCDPNISLSEDQNIENFQSIFDESQDKNMEDQVKDLNILTIEMFQQEQQNNLLTSNDQYQGIKLQVYEKLNEYVNQISTKVIQDQAVKSINQLIQDPNLIQNQSPSNIENSIQEMEIILNKKYIEQENIKLSGQINTGDNKVSRRNQEISQILGNQIKFMDQMTNSFNIIKNRRRRYLNEEQIQENQNKIFNLTKKINKALLYTTIPNQDPIPFEGDSFQQIIQKNTLSKVKEKYFKKFETINGYQETLEYNSFDIDNQEGSIQQNEQIFNTATQIYKENIFKDQQGFPYPQQNEQMYDIDIQNTSNPNDNIQINQGITTNFGLQEDQSQQKVCISQTQDSSGWNTKSCKNIQEEDENGQIFLSCECKSITPTTIVVDINNIFDQSTIGQSFSGQGLEALANFEFWKSIIFYVLLFKTLVLIFLVYQGYQKDLQDVKEKQQIKQEQSKQILNNDYQKPFNSRYSPQSDKNLKINNSNKIKSSKKIFPDVQSQDLDALTNSNCETPHSTNNKNIQINQDFKFNKVCKSKKSRNVENKFKSIDFESSINSESQRNKDKNVQEDQQNQVQNKFQIINIETIGNSTQKSDQQDNNLSENIEDKSLKLRINQNSQSNQNQKQQSNTLPQISTKRNNKETSIEDVQEKQEEIQENTSTQIKQNIISNQNSTKNINMDKSQEDKQQEINKSTNEENSQPEKQEPIYIKHKEVINFVLRIHELLGIHYLFDEKLSRPIRYMCFYLKLLIVLAFSSSIINQESTQYESILISTATSILSGIPMSIIKALLSKKNIIKYVGFFIYIIVSTSSAYLMITNAALMGIDTSNNWTLAYLSSFFIDVFFYQVMQGFAKLAIFNWSIGKQGCIIIIRKILALDKKLSKHFFKEQTDNLDMSV